MLRFCTFILAMAGSAIALTVSPAFSQPWSDEGFLVVEQPYSRGVSFTFLGRSPWLPAPLAGDVAVSYTYQTADEFYFGKTKRPTPGPNSEDLVQKTVWVDGTYGLLDSVALDVRLGFAESDFEVEGGHPAVRKESYSGLADVHLGVTWRLLDEVLSNYALMPSVALRAGGIIAGDYQTGYINSLGDGGDGFEVSALAGKFFADRFAVSGEFGYRNRNNDVPDNLFLRLSAGVALWNRLGLSVNYERVDTPWTSFDIGDPGFSPDRFPEVREEMELIGAGVNCAVSDRVNLVFTYASVIAGRNTADSDVFSVSLGYSFDLF